MDSLTTIQKFAIWVLPVLFAIVFHEVAHGWVADKLGDKTARMLGRLSFNPMKHIDPLGTIAVPALLFFTTGFIFGWAKPVPVTAVNLRNQRWGMALVAAAGPLANLLMAMIWACIAKIGLSVHGDIAISRPMVLMGIAGIQINLILMVLNLLPLPPLDGGRVVSSLLPGRLSYKFDRIEPYGFFILVGLMLTGILWSIMLPPIQLLTSIIISLFGI